jgi:hypothetical protein
MKKHFKTRQDPNGWQLVILDGMDIDDKDTKREAIVTGFLSNDTRAARRQARRLAELLNLAMGTFYTEKATGSKR